MTMDLLSVAKNIAGRVEAESSKHDVPVAVTVIDIHGNIVLTHRMTGAPAFSLELSERKAYTSALVGMRTADLVPLVQPGAELYPLLAVSGGRYSAMGGGVPLTSDGRVLAGVGVSGGTTEQDVAIVEAAVIDPDPPGPPGPSAARVPAGYTEQKARVGDVMINYVRGGSGPTLVLLHGYPQSWYEWRELLPELAKQYTVIAPDLRGAGASDAPVDGYDKKTMAADIHGLLTQLGLADDIRLVGHDIGTTVAYAYAAAHPSEVTRLVLSESPLPDEGLYQFPSLTANGPGFWNFGFFSNVNGLPEDIVAGHEDIWVARFIDALEVRKDAIGPAQVREYASHLRDPAHLRASFEWFRAFPTDVKDNAEFIKTRLPMPVLAVGARGSLGDVVPDQIRRYATDMTGIVIEDCGHWIYEERPQQILEPLRQFLR